MHRTAIQIRKEMLSKLLLHQLLVVMVDPSGLPLVAFWRCGELVKIVPSSAYMCASPAEVFERPST
jgi:hypothetical protein